MPSSDVMSLFLGWDTVFCNSTTDPVSGGAVCVASPWMAADQIAEIRRTLEVSLINGLGTVALGIQTANVENAPDAPVAVDSYVSTSTINYPSAWSSVANTTDGKRLVRLVWLVKNSSGGGNSLVRCSATVEIIGRK